MKKPPSSDLPLLLLDRDGTLMEEGEYLTDPKRVRLLPGVPTTLKRLKRAGFKIVVVSNQSGVGRGIITLAQLKRVNQRFLQLLKEKKVKLDGLYWCPHAPFAGCSCRKPKLGMAKRASRDVHVPWKRAISVGDKPSDVQLGQNTGGRGILVLTGYGKEWKGKKNEVRPDHTARTFSRAADWIIRHYERKES